MNQIYNEDCLITLDRDLEYDYVCFSPPDYDELGLTPIKDDKEYHEWQEEVYSKLKPKKNVVTIVSSNRRYKRRTIAKHNAITNIMNKLGYDLLAEKIWMKDSTINLYRYNYAFVLSYGKGNFKSNNTRLFKYDVWPHKHMKYDGYSYNYPASMIARCIVNYTEENDVVYDPFIGIGTTAIACLQTSRNYYGSELNKKVCDIANNRLTSYKKFSKLCE